MRRLDVYDPEQQPYRVSLACSYMLRGVETTRRFDACFEMGDGDMVAAKCYRRALKNPRLMQVLPRYLNVDMARENYERLFAS